MIQKIYSDNPNPKAVERAVSVLENDGVIVYPTDSLYAFGCSIRSVKAINRIRTIRNKSLKTMSVVFSSISSLSEYTLFDNPEFKILRRNLPGPFTFILRASSRVPEAALGRRKEIGARIPDNAVAQAIVERLGVPMVTASLQDDGEGTEYLTDPELIHERLSDIVDLVIDGGYGGLDQTTVVNLTDGEPEILREGSGELR